MVFNFNDLIEGIGGGATAGSVIPGVGTLAGGLIGAGSSFLGGLFGGGVPGHEDGDAGIIAAALGITSQQAKDLCAMVEEEAGHGGPNFDDIVKDYARNPQELLALIPRYNRKNPSKAIYPQANTGQPTQAQGTQIQTVGSVTGFPSLATNPFVVNQPSTTATPTTPITTYALIGGGALAVLLLLILLLKK